MVDCLLSKHMALSSSHNSFKQMINRIHSLASMCIKVWETFIESVGKGMYIGILFDKEKNKRCDPYKFLEGLWYICDVHS
jgi:hypothetical protein